MNSESKYDPDSLRQLVSLLVDSNEPDEQVVSQLEELLTRFPEAQDDYLDWMSIHSFLEQFQIGQDFSEISGFKTVECPELPVSKAPKPTMVMGWGSLTYLAVSLALVVLGLGTWWLINRAPTNEIAGSSKTREAIGREGGQRAPLFVARVTQVENAQWNDGKSLPAGCLLEPRELNLSSGKAEITFDSGAAVMLEGPARFAIVSTESAVLHSGKAWANVPKPAIGFTIETPSIKILDLGTRFAVNVSESGQSDIAVLEGEVRVGADTDEEASTLVTTMQAVRAEKLSPKLQSIEVPSELSMESWLPDYVSGEDVSFYRWRFDMQASVETVQWPESGIHKDEKLFHAKYMGTERGENPRAISVVGKHGNAIKFNGKGAYLETSLPGIAKDLPRTVCFWLRIPGNAKPTNAYSVIGWGRGGSDRGKKWQVGWNSQKFESHGIQGAIRTEFGGGFVIGSTDLRDDQWHHVACVYVGGSDEQTHGEIRNRIRLYVDGKLETISAFQDGVVNTRTDQKSSPVTIGRRLQTGKVFKTFRGSIDELYLFDGALTPRQILEIIQSNTPPGANEILPVIFSDTRAKSAPSN